MIHRSRKFRLSPGIPQVLAWLLALLGLVTGMVGCGGRVSEKCSWPGKDDPRPTATPVQNEVGAALTSEEIQNTWDRLPRFRRVTAITRVGEPTHHFFVSYRCISPNSLHIEAWRGPDGKPRMKLAQATWGGLSVVPAGWLPKPVPENLSDFEERIRSELDNTDASKVQVSYGGYYREVEVLEAAVIEHPEREESATGKSRKDPLEGPLAWYGRAVFAVSEDGKTLVGEKPAAKRPLSLTVGIGYFCSGGQCRNPWWVKEADVLVATNEEVPGLLDMGWKGIDTPAPAWTEAVLRQTRTATGGGERVPLPALSENADSVRRERLEQTLPADFQQSVSIQSDVYGRKRPGSGVGPDRQQQIIHFQARELVLAIGPVSRQWTASVAGEQLVMTLVLDLKKPLPPRASGGQQLTLEATFSVTDGRGNREEASWPVTMEAFVDGDRAAVTTISADSQQTLGGGHPPRVQLPGNEKYETIDVYWPVRWVAGPPLGAHGKAALE